jgi:hypothetical protein
MSFFIARPFYLPAGVSTISRGLAHAQYRFVALIHWNLVMINLSTDSHWTMVMSNLDFGDDPLDSGDARWPRRAFPLDFGD